MAKPELDSRRTTLRQLVAKLPTIVQDEYTYHTGIYRPVRSWPSEAARLLADLRVGVRLLNDSDLETAGREILHHAIAEMKARRGAPTTEEDIIVAAKSVISRLSVELAKPVAFREFESYVHNFVSWQQVATEKPQRFSISQGSLNGVDVLLVDVRDCQGRGLGTIAVPKNSRIKIKGGPARGVGKAYLGCDDEYLAPEFPPTDIDVLIEGDDPQDYHQAKQIGTSNDGIELLHGEFSFGEYCAGRDVEPNQIYLDADGIHFSNEARDSLTTGVFSVSGKYVQGKALFGSDSFPIHHEGTQYYLYKPRASSRIGKFLVERKMRAARFRTINGRFFDFRLYSLFLIDRWQKKGDRFPIYAQRLHYIMRQMGQTRRGEQNIMQLLESAHQKYTFFRFNSSLVSPEDVTEWYLRKFAKQLDRDLAFQHNLASGFEIVATRAELEREVLLSLDGFEYQPREAEEFLAWFPGFKEKCLHASRHLPPQSNIQRIFFSGSENDGDFDVDELALARIVTR